MRKVKVLDCTLRDGGCINDFNFGDEYIRQIIDSLEKTRIDIIELGYIDENKGTGKGRTQFKSEKVIENLISTRKNKKTRYVAMIDYGKFSIESLETRSELGIDGIRLAFHKKDCNKIIEISHQIIEKGYDLYLQPMITLRYTDKELIDLINTVNKEVPQIKAFYLVDSFGEMRLNDINRIVSLIDHNLLPSISLGFHSHNNLQLSYSNACAILNFPCDREVIIDSSIMGMGKGAGNLNTELFLEHLNIYYGKAYKIKPLFEIIDKVINQLYSEYFWGYSVQYYLSSLAKCTPAYADYFYKKHILSIEQIFEILEMLDEDKKISFDIEYAELLYVKYNNKKYHDDKSISELKEAFSGKTILLVAPGKSILNEKEKIVSKGKEKDTITIALNHCRNEIETDYILVTKKRIFDELVEKDKNLIVTSNINCNQNDNIKIINYSNWIIHEDGIQDSAGVIILNLLKQMEVKEIFLAGFDGFSSEIDGNYYDSSLKRPVTSKQARERNLITAKMIRQVKEVVDVYFLTKSIYLDEGLL